jgi:hypothetical protein
MGKDWYNLFEKVMGCEEAAYKNRGGVTNEEFLEIHLKVMGKA